MFGFWVLGSMLVFRILLPLAATLVVSGLLRRALA